MSNTFLVSLFEHKAWANAGMFDALEAVPAEHPADMAIILLTLEHASIVDHIFKARLIGEPHGFEAVVSRKVPTLGELRAAVAATDAWYIDYVRDVPRDALLEAIDFTFVSDGDPGHMTREQMLAHVLIHSHSHRVAMAVRLAGLNLKGVPDMFTTYLSAKRA